MSGSAALLAARVARLAVWATAAAAAYLVLRHWRPIAAHSDHRSARGLPPTQTRQRGSILNDFISDDELRTFEGWLRYQAVPATATEEELKEWRAIFDENERLRATIPNSGG